jgi:hypothetical protein
MCFNLFFTSLLSFLESDVPCHWEILGFKYKYLFLQKKHSTSQLMPCALTVASYVLAYLSFYFRNPHIFLPAAQLAISRLFSCCYHTPLALKQNVCAPCHILTCTVYFMWVDEGERKLWILQWSSNG